MNNENKKIKKVILLSGESAGHGDEVIGYETLNTVLQSFIKSDNKPHTIALFNNAVALVADDSPLLDRFQYLEEHGVEIAVGKACAAEMGLTDKIAAGKITRLSKIMEFMMQDDVQAISL